MTRRPTRQSSALAYPLIKYLQRTVRQTVATAQVQISERIIRTLTAASQQPIRTQITDAMRIYERDVLGDVTWQQP